MADKSVSSLDIEDRFISVLHRTAPKLPAEMREEFLALLTPQNLAIMAGVFAAWGASHYFGVGFVADLILAGLGLFFLGWQVFQAIEHFVEFVAITSSAKSEADLERAAGHLAEFISMVGVGVFVALLTRGAGKKLGKKPSTTNVPPRLSWKVLSESAERIPGTSIPVSMKLQVGKRVWSIHRDANKLGYKSGVPKGPTTKHLGERAVEATVSAKRSQTDFPISSLAAALERAELQLVRIRPSKSAKPVNIEGWELVVDTSGSVWRLEHAVPTNSPKW